MTFGEFNALHDIADPAAYGPQEEQIALRKVVWLRGLGSEHTAPDLTNIEWHGDLRTDAQLAPDAGQLALVVQDIATEMRFASQEDLHGTATVRNRLPIQAGGLLLVAKRCIARTNRDESGVCGIVQEGVDLFGVKRLGDKRCDVVHRGVQACRLYLEQLLQ